MPEGCGSHNSHRYPVDRQEAEQMFQRFIHMERPSARKIAKEFKRARNTVQRIRRRDKWDERKAAVFEEERRLLDVQRAKDDVSNMQLVTAIKNACAGRIMEKLDSDPLWVPSIKEFTDLVKLEEQLLGNLPPDDTVSRNVIHTNLALVANMTTEEQRQYARELAEEFGDIH